MADLHKMHQAGLDATLAGDFETGLGLYREALTGYRVDGDPLKQGHVLRDMTRAFAGNGNPLGRDSNITEALRIHEALHLQIDQDEVPGEFANYTSELAATMHVAARVALARRVELDESLRDNTPMCMRTVEEMARYWKKAFRLLTVVPDTNQDYLQQVVTHGPLGLALAAPQEFAGLALKMARDKEARSGMNNKRRQMANLGAGLAVARIVGVPVARIKPIRDRVIDVVAGPYLVR